MAIRYKMTEEEHDTLKLGHDAAFVKIFLDKFYEEDRALLMQEIEDSKAQEKDIREDAYIRLKHLKIFYEYIMSKLYAAENVVTTIEARTEADKELEGDI